MASPLLRDTYQVTLEDVTSVTPKNMALFLPLQPIKPHEPRKMNLNFNLATSDSLLSKLFRDLQG